MSKPVNKEDFWKWRLNEAPELRHSVYLTNEQDWKHINDTHEELLRPFKDKRVLDAGCGYGRWSDFFGNYTGIDFSPDFIDKAKELYPHKSFVKANLKDLPYGDNEFDMAFCVSVKEMIVGNLGTAEWELMFNELQRVAKKVLLLEYTNPEQYEEIDTA
jgi:ubiquinone/menaquinone biosynthesis C-methylase UbiE